MSQASDLRRLIQTELSDVHTCMPGRIISFDGRTAVVKPAINKLLADGSELPAPQIVSVPVCFPAGSGGAAIVSVPLAPGDDVLLHFTERALENWLSGTDGVPGDPRMFDLTDAFATPVCRPGVQQVDTQSLVIRFGEATISIDRSGQISIATSGAASISAPGGLSIEANVAINGTLDVTKDVTGGGVSLMHHLTTNVQPGSGLSGEPQK